MKEWWEVRCWRIGVGDVGVLERYFGWSFVWDFGIGDVMCELVGSGWFGSFWVEKSGNFVGKSVWWLYEILVEG